MLRLIVNCKLFTQYSYIHTHIVYAIRCGPHEIVIHDELVYLERELHCNNLRECVVYPNKRRKYSECVPTTPWSMTQCNWNWVPLRVRLVLCDNKIRTSSTNERTVVVHHNMLIDCHPNTEKKKSQQQQMLQFIWFVHIDMKLYQAIKNYVHIFSLLNLNGNL